MSSNISVKNTGEKIKVFIGTEPKTEIPRKVLECSIQRRTEMKVEFIPMIGPEWEYPTYLKCGTGFSLRRWMIPAYCGWQGRAIYMDADQLVFGDVWDLWTQPEQRPGKSPVWCTYQPDKFSKVPWAQTSVMVIDCHKAQFEWGFDVAIMVQHLKDNPKDYANFMHATWLKRVPNEIPVAWNHLNVFKKGETKLLHYTKEPEQPWYKPDHPLATHWKMELCIAIKLGMVTEEMLDEALSKWGVKEDWRDTNGLHPDYDSFRPVNHSKVKRRETEANYAVPKRSDHVQHHVAPATGTVADAAPPGSNDTPG